MHTIKRILLISFFVLAAGCFVSAQDYLGDEENGGVVFRRCVACHYADEEKNKAGPSLKNLMGSQAGTKEGYRYSPAMKQAGEDGLVWTRDTLVEYLRNPQVMVRGTRMAAVRITSLQDVDDLIAYITKLSQEETNKK